MNYWLLIWVILVALGTIITVKEAENNQDIIVTLVGTGLNVFILYMAGLFTLA